MDLSTRRRRPMDTRQVASTAKQRSRNGGRNDAPAPRSVRHHKHLPAHQRNTDVYYDPNAPSTRNGASPAVKRFGSGFVNIDSSRSRFYDDITDPSHDMDIPFDSDETFSLSSSPGNVGEVSESPTEDRHAEPSSGPILRTSSSGSKKTVRSANHLLNFSYPARERPSATSYKRPQLLPSSFKRERFVQSNFRFIVSKDGEYTENIVDPDAVIDWELVEFVICPQSEMEMTCSICLENMTCPRIAKCGHIFCWSCILQLFSYHEHTSLAPCPVCLREKIRIIDLRPVIVETLEHVKVGQNLDLVLLRRPKHLNLLYPTNMVPIMDSKRPLPLYEDSENSRFNRLLVTNDLLSLFTTESLQLEAAIASAKSSQDLTLYMEVAQQMLKEEMAELETKILARSGGLVSSSNSSLTASTQLLAPISKPLAKQRLSDIMPEKLDGENSFFFYQSRDGQLIFLHPLNQQYLLQEFGADADMPELLENVKVLDLETKTFDEKIRRKFPALAHLPLSCQFSFALVDISGLLKSPVERAAFLEDVQKRQNAIERTNEREAKRAEVHAQQHAAKQMQLRQAQVSAKRRHLQTVTGDGANELLPPDLNEHFPEINAMPNASSPTLQFGYAASRSPTTVSAWNKGSIIESIQRASEEEAFPALTPVATHKDKNGNLTLTEESIGWHAQTSTPTLATATTTTSTTTPLSFSAAAVSSMNNANSAPAAHAKGKKKQGKKTILVI